MDPQFRSVLKQAGASFHAALINFPNYVRVCLSVLLWLVIAAAALAAAYIALRSIWVFVHIALKALGIEGG